MGRSELWNRNQVVALEKRRVAELYKDYTMYDTRPQSLNLVGTN